MQPAFKKPFCFFLVLYVLSSCKGPTYKDPQEVYRPIYISAANAKTVTSSDAKALKKPGKIYTIDSLVFVNELYKGIHIINNKDPKNPVILSFISIPGNVDLAVKAGILYADNYNDLVAIDISNPLNVKVVKRIENAFPKSFQNYPPYTDVKFECVDPAKGYVAGWEKAAVQNPKCYR